MTAAKCALWVSHIVLHAMTDLLLRGASRQTSAGKLWAGQVTIDGQAYAKYGFLSLELAAKWVDSKRKEHGVWSALNYDEFGRRMRDDAVVHSSRVVGVEWESWQGWVVTGARPKHAQQRRLPSRPRGLQRLTARPYPAQLLCWQLSGLGCETVAACSKRHPAATALV